MPPGKKPPPLEKHRVKTLKELLRESVPDMEELGIAMEDITAVHDFHKLGERVNQLLVATLIALEKSRRSSSLVEELHQRFDSVDTDLRKPHVCVQGDTILRIEQALDQDVQRGIRQGVVLDGLEEDRKLRDTNKWRTIGIFAGMATFILSLLGGGIWWLSQQAAENRQTRIDTNVTDLRTRQNIDEIRVIRGKVDGVVSSQEMDGRRLTMLEETTSDVVKDVASLRSARYGKRSP